MTNQLFEAIEAHDLNRLATLLSQGEDPNTTDPQSPQCPALHVAIEELNDGGSIEAVILLLRHGAAVNGLENADLTPLLIALFSNQREAVRILLAAGADPNLEGDEGDSPLRWSVEHDDLETAAMLLRCGADKTIDHAGGPSGMTALGRAASRLNLPMIELLIDAGAEPKALDNNLQTAQQQLPPRETNSEVWDAAIALLGGVTHE